MKLKDFKVLTFDCYGTLIDWETGIINALTPLTSRLRTPLSRDAILQAHAKYESRQQKWTPGRPYPAILASVYRRLAEEWGVPHTISEAQDYGQSVPNWPAFPDSTDALQYLKQHFRLVILSNVDARSFSGSNARLNVVFDGIYTAEDIGSYSRPCAISNTCSNTLPTSGWGRQMCCTRRKACFMTISPPTGRGWHRAGSTAATRRTGSGRRWTPAACRKLISASTPWRNWPRRTKKKWPKAETRFLSSFPDIPGVEVMYEEQ